MDVAPLKHLEQILKNSKKRVDLSGSLSFAAMVTCAPGEKLLSVVVTHERGRARLSPRGCAIRVPPTDAVPTPAAGLGLGRSGEQA